LRTAPAVRPERRWGVRQAANHPLKAGGRLLLARCATAQVLRWPRACGLKAVAGELRATRASEAHLGPEDSIRRFEHALGCSLTTVFLKMATYHFVRYDQRPKGIRLHLYSQYMSHSGNETGLRRQQKECREPQDSGPPFGHDGQSTCSALDKRQSQRRTSAWRKRINQSRVTFDAKQR